MGDAMSDRPLANKRIRKNFGKIQKIVDIPDLIGMQRESVSNQGFHRECIP
jgi:DNA-directed RNA polymerase subunit beta